MSGAVALALVCAYALAVGAIVMAALRHASRGTAGRVLAALTGGTRQHVVRLGRVGSVWNPARPPRAGNALHGPGTARYRWDDNGFVHLDWSPVDGAPQHLSGRPPGDLRRLTPPRGRLVAFEAASVLPPLAGGLTGLLWAGTAKSVLIGAAVAVIGVWLVANVALGVVVVRRELRPRRALR